MYDGGASRCALALALLAAGIPACSKDGTEGSSDTSGAGAAAPATSGSTRAPEREQLAGQRIDIPGGKFRAGSLPGEPGRKPQLEPRRHELELGPFSIDRLPFPNDPTKPPLTGISREQAAQKCADAGARLCTELEWERACKGPASDTFATGSAWNAKCAEEPRTCASGFDVLAMGATIREWTASEVVPTEKGAKVRAAVRGADRKEPGPAHRCAHRRGIDPGTTAHDLGFRCCTGAPNGAKVKEPKHGQTFEKTKLPIDRLKTLLASDPHTARLAKEELVYFREPEAANTVLHRGEDDDPKGFLFTVAPLLWQPVAGAEYLVVSARAGKDTSFVVAYWVLGNDEYKLASSFIMENEPGPVAFAYNGYIRPRVHWSTCWGCPGETGKVLFREPDSVVILQP